MEIDTEDRFDLTGKIVIRDFVPAEMGSYSLIYRGSWGENMVAVKVIKTVGGLKTMRRWCSNGDVGRFLEEYGRSMEAVERVDLWGGVLRGVAFLHSRNPIIIHGDLKPGNVLIDDHRNPRICDFGLARIMQEAGVSGTTTTTEHTGTERYLAPELVASSLAKPTPASDVYALGCLGLEFIYLERPYACWKNNHHGCIIVDIREGIPPATRKEDVHPFLDTLCGGINSWEIIEACWRADPAGRPIAASVLGLIPPGTMDVDETGRVPARLYDTITDEQSGPASYQERDASMMESLRVAETVPRSKSLQDPISVDRTGPSDQYPSSHGQHPSTHAIFNTGTHTFLSSTASDRRDVLSIGENGNPQRRPDQAPRPYIDTISNQRKLVLLTPDGHSYELIQTKNFLVAFLLRLDGSDVDDAISSLQLVVEFVPDGHPNKPILYFRLGDALQSRFEGLDTITDIDDAILNYQKAVDLTPDGHPNVPILYLRLGDALQSRFEHLGSIKNIDDAILNYQKAVDLTPDGHPNMPHRCSTLGSALESRFERLGRLPDIDAAISTLHRAVELAPDEHPNKPSWLNSHGGALRLRFKRLGSFTDVDAAISSLQKAVELTPDGCVNKPNRSTNLGNALLSRYQRLGSFEDVDGAILRLRKAVGVTPNRHPNKPSRYNSLGNALRYRFERLGGIADMNDAISSLQCALKLTSDGHPGKPIWLSNLGNLFITRFECLKVTSDLESGLVMLSAAATSTGGSATMQFRAACEWAKTAKKFSRSPLSAFHCVIELLPRIAWLGPSTSDQRVHLAEIGRVVSDAVATAIRYEQYEIAIVWAEQGRSIVWQNQLGLRSPIDDLRIAHPQVANRLQCIMRQLEASESYDVLRNEVQTKIQDVSRNHSKLTLEWENIVDEIRRIPYFEEFFRAKSFSQLAAVAYEGPVVILNAHDSQCDALVLIADDSAERKASAVNIRLEHFSEEKSKRIFQVLPSLLPSGGVGQGNYRRTGRARSHGFPDNEAKLKAILKVLWLDLVKHVIEGLAFSSGLERPPRIWWCAAGFLASLPIHAAGLYDTREIGAKLSDYAVSSYTPTLATIIELSDPVVQEDFQVLMVAQAEAQQAPPIPRTEDEVRIIRRLTAGVRVVNLTRENATVDRVTEGMAKSNWIHLACHGQQIPGDPMSSGFILHDRTLKLSEIVKMSLPKADFAFISACQTAMGDEKAAEGSVHLASGMILSGCRGVIAAMLPIRDDDAPKVAEGVYSRIFKNGTPNRKEAAYALHEAVKRMRDSGAACLSWVPFIHLGR